MNKLDCYLVNDPRERTLRDAQYRVIARLSARTRSVETAAAMVTA